MRFRLSLVALASLAACSSSGPPIYVPPTPRTQPRRRHLSSRRRTYVAQTATATIRDLAGARIGTATFADTHAGLLVSATVTGLGRGSHGVHIHAVGKCESPFTTAGAHFNPERKKHGLKNREGPHRGDLPNIDMPAAGTLKFEFLLPGVTVGATNPLHRRRRDVDRLPFRGRRPSDRSRRRVGLAPRLRRDQKTLNVHIADFALERYFARWEFAVRHVLCASDAETLSMTRAARARRRRRAAALERAPARLHRIARASRPARPRSRRCIPGSTRTTSSRSPAPRKACSSRCTRCSSPASHAVVVWPAYQSLYDVGRSIGASVTLVPLDPRDWSLDVEAVAASMQPNTKVIVVNSPHNPTGAQLTPVQFERLVAIAELHGAHLFSDEVYRFMEHGAPRLPTAAERSDRGHQPRRHVEGVRTRRTAHRLDRDARRRAARAPRAAQGLHDDLQQRAERNSRADRAARARYGARRVRTRSCATISNSSTRSSRGAATSSRGSGRSAGPSRFPTLLGRDVDEFAAQLVEREGVLILPASRFDYPGNHFRLGFGRRDMPEALNRMERFATHRIDIGTTLARQPSVTTTNLPTQPSPRGARPLRLLRATRHDAPVALAPSDDSVAPRTRCARSARSCSAPARATVDRCSGSRTRVDRRRRATDRRAGRAARRRAPPHRRAYAIDRDRAIGRRRVRVRERLRESSARRSAACGRSSTIRTAARAGRCTRRRARSSSGAPWSRSSCRTASSRGRVFPAAPSKRRGVVRFIPLGPERTRIEVEATYRPTHTPLREAIRALTTASLEDRVRQGHGAHALLSRVVPTAASV